VYPNALCTLTGRLASRIPIVRVFAGYLDGPLFRTAADKSGALTRNPMWQQDAYRPINRRTRVAGIKTRIGKHTFRATGITAYLKNANSNIEMAQHIANHKSPRTMKLYDRWQDEISLDEVEKISI
jgi:integrase